MRGCAGTWRRAALRGGAGGGAPRRSAACGREQCRRRPAQFTARTLARIRRDRWRREQFFDAGFNVATVTVIGGVVLAVWMIIDRSGLSAISRDIVDLFGTES